MRGCGSECAKRSQIIREQSNIWRPNSAGIAGISVAAPLVRRFELDIPPKPSMSCPGTNAMQRQIAEMFVKVALSEIEQRLTQASSIAKAAQACGEGNIAKAVEIALETEQLIYEASRLLDAASLVSRMAQTS